MSSDLERLRARVLAARANPQPLSSEQRQRARRHASARAKGWAVSDLVVTRTGEIRTIQETGKSVRGVSRVTTEVFSGVVDEAKWAADLLPPGHARIVSDGCTGWVYDVRTNLGDVFTFFLYYDRYQKVYRVRLIAPRLEKLDLVHETHLLPDGHLCLNNRASGEPMFNNAFAKSSMWADGVSQMLSGHAWPWGEA